MYVIGWFIYKTTLEPYLAAGKRITRKFQSGSNRSIAMFRILGGDIFLVTCIF